MLLQRTLPGLAAVALLVAPQVPAHGQACALAPPNQLGTVTPLEDPCPAGPGPLPNTTCTAVRVQCNGIPPLIAQVRVTPASSEVPYLGTVVLGTGGGGTEFYSDDAGGLALMSSLVSRGFRVVERKWAEGWFSVGTSVRRQSCRYATLITWIHGAIHTGGAFCVTGNSGGSGEIGYALTTWGRGDIVDVAVPTGGPPMSRLDYYCPDPPLPVWQAMCPGIIQPGILQCVAACNLPNDHPVCVSCSPHPTGADLLADSILNPDAVLHYPGTRVHFVIGRLDCSTAAPAGMLWANAITSERIIEFAPNTPHATFAAPEGRLAIERALVGGVHCANGPSTTNLFTWPTVGGTLDAEVHGPPGAAYTTFLGLNTQFTLLPAFGYLFAAPPFLTLQAGVLDAVTGMATVSFPVPNNAGLAGIRLNNQSLTGSCLTNVLPVDILP